MNQTIIGQIKDILYGYVAWTDSSQKFHDKFYAGDWYPDDVQVIYNQIRSQLESPKWPAH